MSRSVIPVIGLSLVLFAVSPSSAVAANVPQEMTAAEFLIGTWNCRHTFGDDGGIYTTTYEKALDGMWLRQQYDFAATRTEPAMQGEYFIGYDERVGRWIRIGAMSDALYFAMVGTRTGDVWSWGYVLPGKTASGAVLYTKKSDTEYVVDGPTYPRNGTPITEHHWCTKAR